MTTRAQAADAEVVWTQFDGKQHQILFSSYLDGEWQGSGDTVYRSVNPLTTPVIGTLPSGAKILIWSEIIRNKVKLMFTQSSIENNQEWGEVDLFSDLGTENLAPALVTDLNGHVWVFWSSSSALPSDVYMRRFDGIEWSKPERIHAANQVPDNAVQLSLNPDGNIYVEWNTFDFKINDYRLDSKTFIAETLTPNKYKAIDTINPADVPHPDFIGSDQRAIIHFPENKLHQSLVLNKNHR